MDDRPTVPSFYVDDSSGPLSYYANDAETQGQCPDVPIPTTGRGAVATPVGSQLGEDAVDAAPSLGPQLRHRLVRRDRTLSAPTLMEHEIGLALRNISDEFNDAYVQQQANQRRRASLPNMNNHHHGHGFRGWWQQVGRYSWNSTSTSSETTAPGVSDAQGSTEPSQRLSVNSIPEEDEEAAERESN